MDGIPPPTEVGSLLPDFFVNIHRIGMEQPFMLMEIQGISRSEKSLIFPCCGDNASTSRF